MRKPFDTTFSRTLALTLIAGALTACGDGEPVDNETARQAVSANTDAIAGRVADSYAFLSGSELFGDAAAGLLPGESECSGSIGPDGEFVEECVEPEPVDVSAEIQEGVDELQAALDRYVFVDGNIESNSGREIVYLLRGQNVCADLLAEDPTGYSECVSSVDAAEVRLSVTSPAAGDVSIDVLVGPGRVNPVSLDVWGDRVALEADLGGIKGAIEHVGSALGEPVEGLPETMSGRARAELRASGAKALTFDLSVLQALRVADSAEGFDISVAPASPALSMTADPDADTLSVDVDWGAIDLAFPLDYETYDEQTGEPSGSVSHAYDLHLGGASASALLTVGQDLLAIQNIGLGADTTTLDIDGKRVVALDLNPDSGRAFDVSFAPNGDAMDVSVSPEFDLSLVLAFHQIASSFPELELGEWALDDTLSVSLTGTDPKLTVGESGLEVVQGTLTISSLAEGITHSAQANQCVVEADVSEPVCAPVEPGDEDVACDEPAGSEHPFSALQVTSCQ